MLCCDLRWLLNGAHGRGACTHSSAGYRPLVTAAPRGDGDEQVLDAGAFGDWARGYVEALVREGDVDVPCGTCSACCESGYLIPIHPDETEVRAHVPADRLQATAGPDGTEFLAQDDDGRCAMHVGGCTIYEHRPRACRAFDCRVLAATGIAIDDSPGVASQAERWRFSLATDDDRARRDAVLAAVAALVAADPDLESLRSPMRRAIVAVAGHGRFLPPTPGAPAEPDAVAVVLGTKPRAR
jgi:uncharacterized protein